MKGVLTSTGVKSFNMDNEQKPKEELPEIFRKGTRVRVEFEMDLGGHATAKEIDGWVCLRIQHEGRAGQQFAHALDYGSNVVHNISVKKVEE